MKRAIIYHLISLIALTLSQYLTATKFDETEIRTIILYMCFMLGTYVHISPFGIPKKHKRRSEDKNPLLCGKAVCGQRVAMPSDEVTDG